MKQRKTEKKGKRIMDKNITVENLVKLYDNDKSADKKNFYSQLKVEDYVSYAIKIEIARKIYETTCMRDGDIVMNSPMKYLLYCRSIVSLYTNIKFADNVDGADDESLGLMMLTEFDALNSRGLFEKIFAKIPEKELVEFNTVLDMVSNDAMTNKYEPHAYFSDLINKLSNVISVIANNTENLDQEEFAEKIGESDE